MTNRFATFQPTTSYLQGIARNSKEVTEVIQANIFQRERNKECRMKGPFIFCEIEGGRGRGADGI